MQYIILLSILLVSCSKQTNEDPPVPQDPEISKYSYIALGDSYTIGESVSQEGRFPEQMQDSIICDNLELDSYSILARTGWTSTNLLNAMDSEDFGIDTADLVTLLIGVNNQYQNKPIKEYKDDFAILLDRAINLAGEIADNVIVVSIPDYGFTPFGASGQATISVELDEYNRINKDIAAEKNARYVNITDISRRGLDESNLVANDGLHPSTDQYTLWVERIVVEARDVLECK